MARRNRGAEPRRACSAAGTFTVGFGLLVSVLGPHAPGLPPLSFLWPPVVVFGVLANVFYTAGALVETLVHALWGRQILRVGPALCRIGLTFSVGLALFPALLLLLTWVARIVFSIFRADTIPEMKRFIVIGIVLQAAMVVAGHFNEAVLNLSGILGTGIPFALGIWYGMTVPHAWGEASKGGFVIGIVGALAGVLLAILMGDQGWMLLTFAPLSSALTGLLGALLGMTAGRRPKTARA